MSVSVGFEVDATGPLFDGSLAAAVEIATGDIDDAVSQEAENLIHQRLGQVLQNPTGRYESRIITERRSDGNTVTDQDAVYGPWLEGTGSRNATTRFKGYATFRQVGAEMEKRAEGIAERALEQRIGGLL
ncbi:MAG: hypothetical protein PVJ28_00235 [Acidimicrobiia bacterium]